MAIDYEFWKFWLSVLNFSGTVILAAYIFVTQRSRVNTERIDKLETHVVGTIKHHDERLTRLEEKHNAAPNHDDFKRVYDMMHERNKQIDQLTGEFKTQAETLKLIHQYLLNEGKR